MLERDEIKDKITEYFERNIDAESLEFTNDENKKITVYVLNDRESYQVYYDGNPYKPDEGSSLTLETAAQLVEELEAQD